MVPAKNSVDEFTAVVRNVPHLFYMDWGIQVPIHFDQPAFIQFDPTSAELRSVQFWISYNGAHPSDDGFIGAEEIEK